MTCPQCNCTLPEGAITCPFCSDAASLQKRGGNGPKLVLLIVGGVLLIGIAVFLIFFFMQDSDKAAVSTNDAPGSVTAGSILNQPEDMIQSEEDLIGILPGENDQAATEDEAADAALPLSDLNPTLFDEWVDVNQPSITLLIEQSGTLSEIEGMGALQGAITVTSENTFTVDGLYPDTPLRYTYSDGKLLREANGDVPAATYMKASEFTQQPADMSRFIGDYAEGDDENGPYYCFTVHSINESVATVFVNFLGYNLSPYYATEPIDVTLDASGAGSFNWTDSWGNSGVGNMILVDDTTPYVMLTMTVTQSADSNRGTLDTNGVKYLYKV
ncbi:MAG: hypothetical protein IJC46_09110 [Clostridia bacterium]|nr:hypothetical protein [Clostridia bacterium]